MASLSSTSKLFVYFNFIIDLNLGKVWGRIDWHQDFAIQFRRRFRRCRLWRVASYSGVVGSDVVG